MANPNPVPRPENLTRAGMGAPRKGRVRLNTTLLPWSKAWLEVVAESQGVTIGEVIEELIDFWEKGNRSNADI